VSAATLVEETTSLGIDLWVEGSELRYRGAKRVVTPDLLDRLKESKPEIVALLSEPPAEDAIIKSTAQVFELAREHFDTRPFDPREHPPPPGMIAHVHTDKVRFFKGDWREAEPKDFKPKRR